MTSWETDGHTAGQTKPTVEGVVVPIVTPITDAGGVDLDGLAILVKWLISRNVDGVFVGGTTGRFSDFCPDEIAEACRVIAKVVGSQTTIFGGICDSGEHRVLDNARKMADAGADFLVTTGPYYLSRTITEAESVLRQVADRSPLPVLYYNLPEFVGYGLRPEWIAEIADHPNAAGYKDSTNDFQHHNEILRQTKGKAFSVLIGKELLLTRALRAGATGLVVSLIMADPDPFVRLYSYAKMGDWEAAEIEQRKIVQIVDECRSWFEGAPSFSTLMRYLEYKLKQQGVPLRLV